MASHLNQTNFHFKECKIQTPISYHIETSQLIQVKSTNRFLYDGNIGLM